ncbi:MAG: phage holin [Gordonibacter sp.]|uniref:phage holin n=1 Tax=Gordonibacter sp. TaxID=1968902 RepID=UPI002FC634E6
MQINWKLRLQNKPTLIALIACVVAFVWQGLGMVGIVPPVSQDAIIAWLGLAVNALVLLGVVTDPTTPGVSDSERALHRDKPSL